MRSVKLKSYTWTKDSHKLFDYECPNLYQNKILTNEPLIIARSGNDVIFLDPSKEDVPSDRTMLCMLQKDSEGRFYLQSANPGVPLKLAIRSIKSKGSAPKGRVLKPGDKMQIGRVEYFIREIKDDKNNVFKAENSQAYKIEKEMDLEESKEVKHCRICLEEDHHNELQQISDDNQRSTDNVFISPCVCKGTSKYVHINCLREWIKSKKQQNKPNLLSQAHRSLNFAMYFSNANATMLLNEPLGMSAIFQNWATNLPDRLLQRSQRLPLNLHQHFFNMTGAALNLDASIEGGMNQSTTAPVENSILPLPTLNRSMTTVSQTDSNPENSNTNPTAPSSQNLAPNLLTMMQIPPARSSNKVENHEFSNFCCDVCKETLPFTIKLDQEREIDTVSIPRPEDIPYMVLEKVSTSKEPKVFSVLKAVENQKILLGRGHSCDIMIPDISVSRSHAYISFQDGNFIINDNNSKFGTLLKLEDSIEILNEKLEIQCGRTLVTVEIKNQDVKMECESLESTIQNNHKVMILCKRPPPLRKILDPERREKAKNRLTNESDSVKTQEIEGLSGGEAMGLSEEKVVPQLNSRSRKISKRAKRGSA